MELRETLVAFFEQEILFNKELGMTVEHLGEGRCTVRIPFRPGLVGDPFRPALHGGVTSTLADTAGGLAVFSQVPNLDSRVSTVDLRVDYLRPARLEDLYCDAEVVRAGNKVAATRMVVRQGADYVVAEGRAVYNVVHKGSRGR